ncbi:hypothetical protein FPV67DRAFT_1431331 [Lyophyllum atratum]|nr:hypothetical protein FPV67DRAFT_1431331 [Lyophyllum atratum]
MPTLPSRLLPAARAVFDALNRQKIDGIIFGGAAAAMIGSRRHTRDVDINVAAYPKIPSTEFVKSRIESHMMQVTLMHPTDAIKCDVVKKCAHNMRLFKEHSIRDEENGIWCAGPALLLADKIRTFSERNIKKVAKHESDLEDIQFCIEKMYFSQQKMPNELKSLYSARQWKQALEALEEDAEDEGHWKDFADALDVAHTD